jgi:hypothetical protein
MSRRCGCATDIRAGLDDQRVEITDYRAGFFYRLILIILGVP